MQMGNSKRQLERHFRPRSTPRRRRPFSVSDCPSRVISSKSTDKSISTIAVECGFCDSSHLSRMFRHRYDRTPSEVRNVAVPAEETVEHYV